MAERNIRAPRSGAIPTNSQHCKRANKRLRSYVAWSREGAPNAACLVFAFSANGARRESTTVLTALEGEISIRWLRDPHLLRLAISERPHAIDRFVDEELA